MNFRRIAAKFDMELKFRHDFHAFFDIFSKDAENLNLLQRMNVLNSEGTISEDEWEAAGKERNRTAVN
jgi:hypothetical protein